MKKIKILWGDKNKKIIDIDIIKLEEDFFEEIIEHCRVNEITLKEFVEICFEKGLKNFTKKIK